MTGGEAAARTLEALGVRTVFGIPSVHNLPTMDAIGRSGGLRLIGARHEQGACSMADAFARVAGGLGVCITSTGPGACNSVASMYEAELSGSPVLHLTGQVATQHLGRGKGVLHEHRAQEAMFASVAKGVFRALRVAEVPERIRQAAALALSGRPGPVVVELPIDVQYAAGEAEVGAPAWPAPPAPDAEGVRAAAERIAAAERVVLWAGGGAVRARADIAALAEHLGALVVTSANGRGAIDEAHPLCAGVLTADPEVSAYLEAADVWVAIGTRFRAEATAEWRLRPPRAIVHVNVDPTERDRNYPAAVFLAADAARTVQALLAAVPARPTPPEVPALAAAARARALERLGPVWGRVVADLEALLPEDTVLVRDATMAAYVFGNRLVRVHRPGASVYPAGVAIGLGLPFALGAQLAAPERPVVALCGDGGFMLNVGELAVAVQHRIPVIVLLFNDAGYEVLRRAQDRQFAGRRVGVDLHAPDFATLCAAFGVAHRRAASAAELAGCLAEALGRRSGPQLIEVDLAAMGPIPR